MLLALAGVGLAAPACEINQLFSWNGGKPVLFGYGTAPNYDKKYKTIRIKIFKNPTFWAVVPVPGLEMELTQALVRELELKTPYKIVSGDADLEISGSILSFLKVALNYTQQNETREVETTLTAQVVLKDLRTGEILSQPAQRAAEPLPPAGLLPGQLDPLNAQTTLPGSIQSQQLSAAPISPGGQPATMSNASPPPTAGNPVPGATNFPGAPGAPPGAAGLAAAPLPFQGVVVRSVAYFRPEIGQSISTAQQDNVNFMAEQIVSMMEKPW
jgi:hypothetical protein